MYNQYQFIKFPSDLVGIDSMDEHKLNRNTALCRRVERLHASGTHVVRP